MKSLMHMIFLVAAAIPAGAQTAPGELAAAAGCNGCHQLEQKMLGPSYLAVAERYRGQQDAPDQVFKRMRDGSQGVWGNVPMPPVGQDTLTDEELRAVIDWVLSR